MRQELKNQKAENDYLKLYTDTATGYVAVYDKRDGNVTYSNPMNAGLLRFVVNGVIFVGFFGITMLLFCMNNYEKNLFIGTFKKILKK